MIGWVESKERFFVIEVEIHEVLTDVRKENEGRCAKNELEICRKSDFVLSLHVGKYGLQSGMMMVRTSKQ